MVGSMLASMVLAITPAVVESYIQIHRQTEDFETSNSTSVTHFFHHGHIYFPKVTPPNFPNPSQTVSLPDEIIGVIFLQTTKDIYSLEDYQVNDACGE